MRKVIGVVSLYDDEKDSWWMVPGYIKMLEEAGATPLMIPLTTDREELDFFLEICGGFLLTGGHDVSPEVYHEDRLPECGQCCSVRDEMEGYLLSRAVEADKAVLGICRGVQFMNAYYGGTLYQDLPSQYDSKVEHHMAPPYDRAAHEVNILPGTQLFDILEKERIGVNSYHHQAVRELSPSFKAGAISEDGLIEAIYMPDRRFAVGVQWHPEFSYKTDENSRRLVAAFVGAVNPQQL